jgi:hypothetical protein
LQLLDTARRDQGRFKEKQDLLKQRVREVERMIDRQALTEAIDLARQTITTVGAEPRLSDILATAERELEFREQKKRDQEEKMQMARALLGEGKFDEAASAVKEALDMRLFAESDPRVRNLLEEIHAKKKSASGSDSSSGGMAVLSDVFPAGTKGDPAKDYVYVRKSDVPKEPVGAEQNISAAAAGSGQGASIGLPAPAFDPGWQDRERQFLSNVEKQLAAYVGPIAGIIASRTAAKAKDPAELITLLASTLHVEADRKAFLARRNELLRGLTRPVAGAPQFDTQTIPRKETQTLAGKPITQSLAQPVALTPAGIHHAGELLARYLGPVAKILAERAAPRAASEQALYAALAEHLQNPAERARFLQDAGYPES